MPSSREVVITLKQRPWQKPLVNYFRKCREKGVPAHASVVAHRRAGKDRAAMFIEAEQMLHGVPCEVWHGLPEYNQARKVVWNALTKDGERLIDVAFPKDAVRRRNEQEMMIELHNGSIWRAVGADNINSLVGSNPRHVTFSEFALMHSKVREFVRPILAENGGSELLITTPRGYNHAYELHERAKQDKRWYAATHPVSETKLIPLDVLKQERDSMPEELYRQEYECSFSAANVGAILGSRVEDAEREGRVGDYPLDPDQQVILVADIGHRDATAVWFMQPRPDGVAFIDYDEESGLDAEDWIERLRDRYDYGAVWLPHDARAKTFATKTSAMEMFIKAGFKVRIVPNVSIAQRINAARMLMPTSRFDKSMCPRGLHVLRNWSYKWDDTRRIFSLEPDHNEFSHGGDSYSYAAVVARTTMKFAAKTGMLPKLPDATAGRFTLDRLFADQDRARDSEWL